MLVSASCEMSETPKEAAPRSCYSFMFRDRISLSSPSQVLRGSFGIEITLDPGNPSFPPKPEEESIGAQTVSLDDHAGEHSRPPE